MHNYIIVVRKQDLADLVNYGEIFVPLYSVIPYQGDYEQLRNNREVCREAFAFVNPFSYTSSYVVLDFESEEQLTGADSYNLKIGQVRHVAPVDRDGKTEMDISWGAGFDFSAPLWDGCIADVVIGNSAKLARCGARDLWDILDIKADIGVYDDLFDDDFVHTFCFSVYNGIGHDGLASLSNDPERLLWLYLLRYERHQPFAVGMLGYVLDAVCTFHNWRNRTDFGDKIRSSPIIQFLQSIQSLQPGAKLSKLLLSLKEKAEQEGGVLNSFMETVGLNGKLGSMALFLKFKSVYKGKGNDLGGTIGTLEKVLQAIDVYKDESDGLITADSIYRAIYMLGLTISRDGTCNEWCKKKGIAWIKDDPAAKLANAGYKVSQSGIEAMLPELREDEGGVDSCYEKTWDGKANSLKGAWSEFAKSIPGNEPLIKQLKERLEKDWSTDERVISDELDDLYRNIKNEPCPPDLTKKVVAAVQRKVKSLKNNGTKSGSSAAKKSNKKKAGSEATLPGLTENELTNN